MEIKQVTEAVGKESVTAQGGQKVSENQDVKAAFAQLLGEWFSEFTMADVNAVPTVMASPAPIVEKPVEQKLPEEIKEEMVQVQGEGEEKVEEEKSEEGDKEETCVEGQQQAQGAVEETAAQAAPCTGSIVIEGEQEAVVQKDLLAQAGNQSAADEQGTREQQVNVSTAEVEETVQRMTNSTAQTTAAKDAPAATAAQTGVEAETAGTVPMETSTAQTSPLTPSTQAAASPDESKNAGAKQGAVEKERIDVQPAAVQAEPAEVTEKTVLQPTVAQAQAQSAAADAKTGRETNAVPWQHLAGTAAAAAAEGALTASSVQPAGQSGNSSTSSNFAGLQAQAEKAAVKTPAKNEKTQTASTQEKTVEKIKELLQTAAQQRQGNSLVMQLDPPSLGAITVKITQKGNHVFARLAPESPEVEAMLRGRVNELMHVVGTSGLKSDQVHISIGKERSETESYQFNSFLNEKGMQQKNERNNGWTTDGFREGVSLTENKAYDMPRQIDLGWVA